MQLLSRALSNSNRRRFGEGIVGRLFNRTLKRRSELTAEVVEQLDDIDDHRPYFTYWVTTVQILVMIISLVSYGLGPLGFSQKHQEARVLASSLVREHVSFVEQDNFWLGPRFTDLVHLGAKYTPCMRRDQKIQEVVASIRASENKTACCILNDNAGCWQTPKENCPDLIATWKNATTSVSTGRPVKVVCGEQPDFCLAPPSVPPLEWSEDITEWPICRRKKEEGIRGEDRHMTCEITGRPCCVGIYGQCKIATREYCDFVHGYFHEEATLCSQVSCLGEVCGMIPFFRHDRPDQIYRLIISLFLHAGIIHLVFTLLIQFVFMRDLEKLIGWFRLAVIYLAAGIGGNLASAIFVPYQVEVGPAGSQFGLLAGLFVDAIYSWQMIVRPWKALLQLSGVLAFLLVLGLLPWIDNWAHSFGFIFGLLLSFSLFPYIQFQSGETRKRALFVIGCICLALILFAILIIFFYVSPVYECQWCEYFNCINFIEHFCDNQGLKLMPQPT